MWLLDVNVPQQTLRILNEFEIIARHATPQGWNELKNGELIEAAAGAGFVCILTRDRQFAESASRSLRRFPDFAVVLIELPQLKRDEFNAAFRKAFSLSPIQPRPGLVVHWPETAY